MAKIQIYWFYYLHLGLGEEWWEFVLLIGILIYLDQNIMTPLKEIVELFSSLSFHPEMLDWPIFFDMYQDTVCNPPGN